MGESNDQVYSHVNQEGNYGWSLEREREDKIKEDHRWGLRLKAGSSLSLVLDLMSHFNNLSVVVFSVECLSKWQRFQIQKL